MSLKKPTKELGVSLNQARKFPEIFRSWLGGVVLSFDSHSVTLGGQGLEVRALHSGVPITVGDKILIKISDDHFKKWLDDSQYLVCQIIEVKILTSYKGSLPPALLNLHLCQLTRRWSDFVHTVRQFFRNRGFIETPTPSLVSCPGWESTLEPFETTLSIGRNKKKLFLPTSPELHLKKLLSQGWSEIFEIKQSFRNGELSPHHQPEFTILEWYRAYDSLSSLIDDIKDLLFELNDKKFILGSLGHFQQHSMSQLFFKFTGLNLRPSTTKEELIEYCHHISQPVNEDDTWNDIFHLIFIHQIEPHLGKAGPEFVYDFPASQAVLAKVNDKGWADRFEFYWRGLEIGNAFNELLDPVEHRKRFNTEMDLREKKGQVKIPIDEDFMTALNGGLPPCVGMAMGLERLFLACQKMEALENLRLFPFQLSN